MKKRDEELLRFAPLERAADGWSGREWWSGEGGGENRRSSGASSARRVVPASFPVLIGRWLVAGARRHSPETRVGARPGPRRAPFSRLRLPPHLAQRSLAGIAGRTTRRPFRAPLRRQRRIKMIRDLERNVISKEYACTCTLRNFAGRRCSIIVIIIITKPTQQRTENVNLK